MQRNFADLLGFPFERSLLSGTPGPATTDLVPKTLQFLHTTSVDPTITHFESVIADHLRFKAQIQQAGIERGIVYGLQNPPEGLNAEKVTKLKELGVIFMTIAHADANEYGGGYAVPNAQLTDNGKRLLCYMTENQMFFDFSHAGYATARGILRYIEESNLPLKVAATHSACHAVYKHPRNFPDDILRGIAGNNHGGIIGLPTVGWHLQKEEEPSFSVFFNHLEHLLDTVGEDHVAIGSTSSYTRTHKPANISSSLESLPGPCPDRMEIFFNKIAYRFGEVIARKVTGENVINWL